MEDKSLQNALEYLLGLQEGARGYEIEIRLLEGLRITQARKGFVRCSYIVPSFASDVDGNWHVGAMATLMDMIGATAVFSLAIRLITSVDLNISYHSTAKIQEDVEIEANVMADKGMLTQVMVEVRRKGNGELIASGKLWTASNKLTAFKELKKVNPRSLYGKSSTDGNFLNNRSTIQ